jgi:acetyl-CoA/propionyl-CoA carboxylase biotin carboxyl carrier protein
MTIPQAFDSLIGKLIITGANRRQALARARRALAEFEVAGLPTVLPFHRAVVDDPAFTGEPFSVHTRWIETEFATKIPPYSGEVAEPAAAGPDRERITVEVGGKRLEVVLPGGLGALGQPAQAPGRERTRRPGRRDRGPASAGGGDALVSPMQGTIAKIVAEEGEHVSAGDTVVVLEAMKMEQPITAHKDGTVTGLAVQIGQTVPAGGVICELKD